MNKLFVQGHISNTSQVELEMGPKESNSRDYTFSLYKL